MESDDMLQRKERASEPAAGILMQDGAARLAGYAAANLFRVPPHEIWAASRRQARVARARQTAAYLVHVGFSQSLSAVAAAFGRHRTTIGHACARLEEARDHGGLDRCLDLLEAALRAHASAFLAEEARP
jgi:hypothetical protein